MNTVPVSSTDYTTPPPFIDNEKLAWFKEILLDKKAEVLRKRSEIKQKIRGLKEKHADVVDQSILMRSIESEIYHSCRCEDLIGQIESALERIEEGRFGYCELSGEPINMRRLEVQPWATFSIEALNEIENRHGS